MEVVIKKEKGQHNVYKDGALAGNVREFCCGTDFYPIESTSCFSILKIKFRHKEMLITCLEALLSVKMPKDHLHWNFRYETAVSETLMKGFRNSLKKYKRKPE